MEKVSLVFRREKKTDDCQPVGADMHCHIDITDMGITSVGKLVWKVSLKNDLTFLWYPEKWNGKLYISNLT